MDLNILLSLIQGTETGSSSPPLPGVPGIPSVPTIPPVFAPGILPSVSADVYHRSATTSSPSLLPQRGVNAYIQLLNALTTAGHNEKSATALTNRLLETSATLKSAYHQALSQLPPPLQAKDWRFSVVSGSLVFTQGKDELSPQDFTNISRAFTQANVESIAKEVAAAITSMESKRNTDANSGSLAWGRFKVDETNFGSVVDLRAYLTATAPGGKYDTGPNAGTNPMMNPANHPEIPMSLGRMYLGDLVTTRPDFFRENPTTSEARGLLDGPRSAETAEVLQGRCSCGSVCFTVENEFDYAFYCHCSRCRARTGSAFAAVGGATIDKLQVTVGNELLLIEGECSDGYGARCSRCFAFLFAAVRGRQYVHVSLGVLAGTPNRAPDHHIYVGSKAPWFQITDMLPQHDELP